METSMMDAEWLRKVCLALPHTTEQIQWGYDLVFKVGGKMFAVAPLEPAPVCLSFKCSEESFAELTERPQIIPAPYMARAKWVALESPDAIARAELAELLRASYELVFAKLPKRIQAEMSRKERPKSVVNRRVAGKSRKSKKN
jgi:predicted DNA-binding protein (MmcQ/YjbR family)